MKNAKTITTIAAIFAVFLSPVTFPYVASDAGTVEDYYWHSDTGMCYSESSLDDLDFNDSTGNGDDVIDEMEKSRSTYNGEMNRVTINEHGWFSCYNNHIDVQSESQDGAGGILAYEISYKIGTRMTQSEIRFDSDEGWGGDSNKCTLGDIDIEWIMNHEMGHSIGLKHHNHNPPNSVMHPICNAVMSSLQPVDDTTIDIRYA